MNTNSSISRRQFISAAAAATVGATLPAIDIALGQSSTPVAAPAAPHGLDPEWASAGIIATRNSPYAKLKSVPVRAVTITTGFWSKRRQTNVDSSIPSMRVELIEHGRMDNFLRLEGKSAAPQSGPVYSDSDIYKWMEAVGFALQSGPLPELRAPSEEMIRQVVAAQEPGGYLNTYFVESMAKRSHAPQNADRRPRTLLHRPSAAGRDRLVSRHRRSHAAECRPAFRR